MKIKNRLFALLLAFTMVLTYMPALAFAEEIPDSDVAAGAEEEISGEKGEEPDTETDVAQEKESEEEAIVTDSEKAEEPMAEETKAENGTLSKEGEGDGEETAPKVLSATLNLSEAREEDNKTLWGYVNSQWPSNYPLEGDSITVKYDNGKILNYIYSEDNTGGLFSCHLDEEDLVLSEEDWGIGTESNARLEKGSNDFFDEFYDKYDNYITIHFNVNGIAENIDFTYIPANDIVLYEGIDGHEVDGSGDTYFYWYNYDNYLPLKDDKIVMGDETYTCDYTMDENGHSVLAFIGDKGDSFDADELDFWDDQDTKHWEEGSNNVLHVTYLGVTRDISVSVKALKGISFTNSSGTDNEIIPINSLKGYIDGNEYIYMYFRGIDDDFFVVGDKATLEYGTGEEKKTITCEYQKGNIDGDECYGWHRDDIDYFDTLDFAISDSEVMVGLNNVYITLGSKNAVEPYKITVTSDIEKITYNSNKEVILTADDLETVTDDEGEEYEEYYCWWSTILNTDQDTPDTVTVEYSDGNIYTYTAGIEDTEEDYDVFFICNEDTGDHPQKLIIQSMYDDQSADNKWEPGEHEVTLLIEGVEVKRKVIVEESIDAEHFEANEPTCTEPGNEEYWKKGDKYYSDEACENEIEEGSWVISARGHDWEKATYDWAADYSSVTATRVCSRDEDHVETKTVETTSVSDATSCDVERHVTYTAEFEEPYETQTIVINVPAGEHTWVKDKVVTAATCTEPGKDLYKCSVCDATEERETDALGHTMTHHAAVAASCTEAGTVEYWSCSRCEKNFGDEDGETELTTIVDPAKGHTMTHHAAEPATCTEAGTVEYWSCSRCEKNFSDEAGETELTTIVDPAKGHTMTHHAAEPATCTEAGTVEYWSCSVCEKNFSDEAGKTELTDIVDPAGHIMTHHAAVAASCTEAGTVEYWSCSRCEKNFSDEAGETELTTIVDPAKGHTMTHHAAVAASCTEAGNVEYWSCSRCEKNFSDEAGETELTTIVDPAKGHTMTHHAAEPATCTEDGTVEYWSCSVCEKIFGDQGGETELTNIVDPAKGHTMTHHAAEAATCTEDGNVEYWSCSVCEKNFSDEAGETELTDTDIVDPAKGHTMTHHAAEPATYTEDGNVEYWSCSVCGKNFSDEAGETELTDIVDPAPLTTARNAAKGDLSVAESKLNQYDEADRAVIQQAINDAKTKIEEAQTVEAVNAAKDAALSVMNSKKTIAQKQAEIDAALNGILDPSMPKVTIRGAKKAKAAFTARWKKLSKKNKKLVQGIEVEYASDPYFTQGVVFRSGIKKTKTALKIKKLERKKYYWVHVRTYKWVGNTKYVSSWSKSKKVKTK